MLRKRALCLLQSRRSTNNTSEGTPAAAGSCADGDNNNEVPDAASISSISTSSSGRPGVLTDIVDQARRLSRRPRRSRPTTTSTSLGTGSFIYDENQEVVVTLGTNRSKAIPSTPKGPLSKAFDHLGYQGRLGMSESMSQLDHHHNHNVNHNSADLVLAAGEHGQKLGESIERTSKPFAVAAIIVAIAYSMSVVVYAISLLK